MSSPICMENAPYHYVGDIMRHIDPLADSIKLERDILGMLNLQRYIRDHVKVLFLDCSYTTTITATTNRSRFFPKTHVETKSMLEAYPWFLARVQNLQLRVNITAASDANIVLESVADELRRYPRLCQVEIVMTVLDDPAKAWRRGHFAAVENVFRQMSENNGWAFEAGRAEFSGWSWDAMETGAYRLA